MFMNEIIYVLQIICLLTLLLMDLNQTHVTDTNGMLMHRFDEIDSADC